MITIPIWVFVILVTLSLAFTISLIVAITILIKMEIKHRKVWEEIINDTFKNKYLNNEEE